VCVPDSVEETTMVKLSALACMSWIALAGVAAAQTAPASPAPSRSPVELVGCVSDDPIAAGSFTLDDSGGGRYRLTGKSVRKYAGRMVRLVGGPQGKRLSIRGGLWPSPNIAAQAGAIDSAQASIARQPGGAASGTGGVELPVFRVSSVRGVEGSCR
jgi:hypothetical protein